MTRMWRKLQACSDWQIAFAITVLLRVFYSAVAAIGAVILHHDAVLIKGNAFTQHLPAPHGWHYALLGIWQRFDTLWYLRIAERGYDQPAGVVYYPLYPLLIRALSGMISPVAAALLISSASAFFYFGGVLRLARNEFPDTPPYRTLILTAVWPASFFLFAGYTEALALAWIVWCIALAREERFGTATAFAIAAGLTRSAGTLLLVPLLTMAFRSRAWTRWLVVLSPSGTFGYWWWLRHTGRMDVPTAYRTYWNTTIAPPWTTLWQAVSSLLKHADALVVVSLVALTLFFITGVVAHRRLEDRFFSAAVIVQILLRSCFPPLLGTLRYLLPVYPAYLTMGKWAENRERSWFAFCCGVLFAFNLAWMWAFLKWSLVL